MRGWDVHGSRRRLTRREFLAAAGITASIGARALAQRPSGASRSRPRPSEFVFARLRYDSGDWDYNPKVAGNILDTVVQYTTIPVYGEEVIITADSPELASFPFVFMTGPLRVAPSHELVAGHEDEMRRTFPGSGTLAKIPNSHQLYRSFFTFEGPPQTSHELNGWGDDMVHDYLRGVERHGRLGVVYSNKDYGCEWDYDWRNKRFRREDNTKFAVNLVVYAMT